MIIHFYQELITPPISRPAQNSRGDSASRLTSGQNPGGGCSGGNPTPKTTHELMYSGLGPSSKTKKQKALEKRKEELKESIKEEDKINGQLEKQGKASITLIIKGDTSF